MLDLPAGIRRNRARGDFAFASVCSSHPDVLAAALGLARDRNRPVIVEATCNQVNQFGGYSGMTPAGFRRFAEDLARQEGCPAELVSYGGDHLGTQPWRDRPAEEALALAGTLVADFVRAGFTKIHLDCSEGCLGEPRQLGDATVAARAARLALACEAAAPDPSRLSYVIGTEVPPPGGARQEGELVAPTDPANARRTLAAHRDAFAAAGLAHAWPRVAALVVQPGLEFGPAHVDRFDAALPDLLSPVLDGFPGLAFEAHSTDYQEAAVFAELARRHFAVLKVGPALTFAYREAVYALSHVDGWLNGTPHLSALMEAAMQADPGPWRGHYHGSNAHDVKLMRHFGLADRIRYYWAQPGVQDAVAALAERIDTAEALPEALLQQYMPGADLPSRAGGSRFRHLVRARIARALEPYLI
ncbi:class II D-tagatose-bisphosphate aldolase non-catalytic subunit [Poseidonocella sp. HB161398]|uniref:class II D-tagatose-bisphosphate aldolase non-catalytic subunit n=1 Tax=Poseidonocella sp. HB161398 TaxID=2320855 RepID=UPI001107ACDB|nr:class II D-tagatose-bisphosphate aldolase, non-catalytic subunit [Poseidonocella sp. HB161398]